MFIRTEKNIINLDLVRSIKLVDYMERYDYIEFNYLLGDSVTITLEKGEGEIFLRGLTKIMGTPYKDGVVTVESIKSMGKGR